MPYDVKRFIFSVSLCAMLAANPVLATAPTNDEELGTTHDVYVESTLNQATNGIAGVSYVNRMVNAAGNAADAAEAPAAAAGAPALSAAQSADEAHKVLSDIVNIDQVADNKNKAMVTDDAGSVYPGYVNANMISTTYNNASGQSVYAKQNSILMATAVSGVVAWGMISGDNIADETIMSGDIASGAIYSGHITADAIRMGHIANGAVGADKLSVNGESSSTGFLAYTGSVDDGEKMVWRMVKTEDIADGAVTEDDIADGAVTESKIDAKTVDVLGPGSAGILVMISGASNNNIQWLGATGTAVMKADKNGVVEWGQLGTDGIANGAVTIDKTAGVVGMVPVGSADATTYGQFWIE